MGPTYTQAALSGSPSFGPQFTGAASAVHGVKLVSQPATAASGAEVSSVGAMVSSVTMVSSAGAASSEALSLPHATRLAPNAKTAMAGSHFFVIRLFNFSSQGNINAMPSAKAMYL
jgi:hypothetical protein